MADPRSPGYVSHALLEDGSLVLRVDPDVAGAVEAWRPRFEHPVESPGSAAARLVVEPGEPAFASPEDPPLLELRGLRGWVPPPRTHALLADTTRRVSAVVDLDARRATVRLADPDAVLAELAVELSGALSISAALLLNRLDRALVHAAAVVAPDGRAWLLAGGTFSGKTTTTLNLIRGGWDWLSDDHVVLGAGPDGELTAEGWPRPFNLDSGAAGRPTGARSRVDPAGFGPGRWRRSAPLGGLLLPRVVPELPTAVAAAHPAAALGKLVEQSPWLLADPGGARPVLALLERAARLPAFELRLGLDAHLDPRVLHSVLASALPIGKGAFGPEGDASLDRAASLSYGPCA
ncbi:MAG TPA: hypothetical protein VF092_11010 [Longimicrobium sp.]